MPQLWGAGFNTSHHITRNAVAPHAEEGFSLILSGDDIKVLYAGWDYTIIHASNEIHVFSPDGRKQIEMRPASQASSSLKDVWAADGLLRAAISNDGATYSITHDTPTDISGNEGLDVLVLNLLQNSNMPEISHLAWSHEGSVCITIASPIPSSSATETRLIQFRTPDAFAAYLKSYGSSTNPPGHATIDGSAQKTHMFPERVTHLVGSATSFAALTVSGSVYTWGSALQPQMLAREVQDSTPAETPGIVDTFEGLFVDKVAMCEGWLGAALTRGGDVYAWGSKPGAEPLKLGMSDEDEMEANGARLCGRDEWGEVKDIGVGMEHIVVLVDGRIFVSGRGQFGQLGLGDAVAEAREWTEVGELLQNRGKVKEVAATRWDTFVVVD